MGDVGLLVKRLALGNNAAQVERKALEYLRRANAILGHNSLGKAEICKSAVCVDLACLTLQVPLDSNSITQCSGVAKAMYKNSRATLQKALGVRQSSTARDLCISFGCTHNEPAIRAAFTTFKQRFLATLHPTQQKNVDLSRPVFLAAAFFLVTRKKGVKIAKDRLLSQLGVTSSEFTKALNTMSALLPEISLASTPNKAEKNDDHAEKKKSKKKTKTNNSAGKRKSRGDDDDDRDDAMSNDDGNSDSDDENIPSSSNPDYNNNDNNTMSQQMTPKKMKNKPLTENMLRDIVLRNELKD